MKNALTKAMEADEDPYITLLELRNTPVDSFMSPARLLMGRNTRSVVPVLNLKNAVVDDDAFQERRTKMQAKQKMYYDKGTRSLEDLEKGDKVVMYDKVKKLWRPATILKMLKKRSYLIDVNGRKYRRNRQHLKKIKSSLNTEEVLFYIHDNLDASDPDDDPDNRSTHETNDPNDDSETHSINDDDSEILSQDDNERESLNTNEFETRTSTTTQYGRTTRAPDRLSI